MSKDIREGNFYLITGFGHSGTAWLADVLNRPEDKMVCHHELKGRTVPLSWPCGVGRHEFEKGLDNHFDEYFSVIRNGLEDYAAVGDSNSWSQLIIPEVAKRQRIHRIIYLVRNGIQAVHSMFQHYEFIMLHNAFHRDPHILEYDDFVFNNNYPRFLELAGKSYDGWAKYTRWGKFCLMWRIINMEAIEWLRGRLGPASEINVYRFEDLLADGDLLMDLLKKINPDTNCSVEELAVLQATDVNRKTMGDRSPSALWNEWSDEQRKVFEEICGPTMKAYGYEIPSTVMKKEESSAAWAETYLTEKGLINLLHQSSPDLLNYFAEREAMDGRKKEAVSLLLFLLSRWPRFMKAHYNLGRFSEVFGVNPIKVFKTTDSADPCGGAMDIEVLKPFVLWLTGLSGSGKTTLALAIKDELLSCGSTEMAVLDGDDIRKSISGNLGFSKDDRHVNNLRTAARADEILKAGRPVCVSLISPYSDTREAVREMLPDFIEVYVKCPLEICEKRDVKGLYKLARNGKIANFTGVTDPYEEPSAPEIVVETDRISVSRCVYLIVNRLKELGCVRFTETLVRDNSLPVTAETVSTENYVEAIDVALQLLNAVNERGERLASQNETDKAYDIFSGLLNKIDALRSVLINNMAVVHIHKQNYEVADYLLDCLVKEGHQSEALTANLNALKFLLGQQNTVKHD
ncbi:MAG: adenylyl-sulfate kinase [Nitrospiraceae bacterium]|nr:MAG: adenylyl-sulfate kinase [Nitrospiraceae bacterium]